MTDRLIELLTDLMDHSGHDPKDCNHQEIKEAKAKVEKKQREVIEELRDAEVHLYGILAKRKGSSQATNAMRALQKFQSKMNDLELSHAEARTLLDTMQLRLRKGIQLCEYEEEIKMELQANQTARDAAGRKCKAS
jgi:hypothetical protein